MKKRLSWLDRMLFGRVLRTQVDAMNLALTCQRMQTYQTVNHRHNTVRRTCALLEKRG